MTAHQFTSIHRFHKDKHSMTTENQTLQRLHAAHRYMMADALLAARKVKS